MQFGVDFKLSVWSSYGIVFLNKSKEWEEREWSIEENKVFLIDQGKHLTEEKPNWCINAGNKLG